MNVFDIQHKKQKLTLDRDNTKYTRLELLWRIIRVFVVCQQMAWVLTSYCMWHLIVFKNSFCNSHSFFFLHIMYSVCVRNTCRENTAPVIWHIFAGKCNNAKDDICTRVHTCIILFFHSCYLMIYLILGYVLQHRK